MGDGSATAVMADRAAGSTTVSAAAPSTAPTPNHKFAGRAAAFARQATAHPYFVDEAPANLFHAASPLFVLRPYLLRPLPESRVGDGGIGFALLRPSASDEDGCREGGTVIADTTAGCFRVRVAGKPDELRKAQLSLKAWLHICDDKSGLPGGSSDAAIDDDDLLAGRQRSHR